MATRHQLGLFVATCSLQLACAALVWRLGWHHHTKQCSAVLEDAFHLYTDASRANHSLVVTAEDVG